MKNQKTKKSNVVLNVLTVISLVFILWVTASFIEVNSKNLEPNPQYNQYNFFVLMTANNNKEF